MEIDDNLRMSCYLSCRNAATRWHRHAPAQREIWNRRKHIGSTLIATVDGRAM